jgi:rubredoxin
MATWAELNDFSDHDGTFPCVLCKADSSKTLVGNHWKCSVCAHVFNEDGSELKVQCYCDACSKAKAEKEPQGMSLEDLIKKVSELKDAVKKGKGKGKPKPKPRTKKKD